jgi:hypothetical protein
LVFAPTSRALFQAIAVAGVISLGATFAIHFAVGYQDPWHLTPAIIGLLSLSVGEFLAYPALSGVRAEAAV